MLLVQNRIKVSNLSGVLSPFSGPAVRLGQLPQGWGIIPTVPDEGTPPPSSDTSCYTCGPVRSPRQMSDAMAAAYPGGCTKLDPSECAAAAIPPPSGPAALQPGLHPGQAPGALDINLTVFRADTEKGIQSSVEVDLVQLDQTQGTPTGTPANVFSGQTDADGKLLFHGTSPAPAQNYQFKITASSPGVPGFKSQSIMVQAYQPNGVPSTDQMVVVCPDGVDDLVCEIGEKQLYFSKVLHDQMVAWNVTPDSVIGMRYAVDTAHFFMAQMGARNPILSKYWGNLSWAVTDLGIPPTDWPDLVKNYDQVQQIFNLIPWPSTGDVEALFKNCAGGLPLYNGWAVTWGFRLYAKTFSDYFPREDYKIRADMGASYLLSIHMIFQCMVDKLQQEAADLQKHLASLSVIRLATAFIFAPLTGGAMLGILATESLTMATSVIQNKEIAQGTSGVIAGLAKTAGFGAAAMGASLFAVGAGLLVSEITKGADPAVQKIADEFGPQVAQAASKDILENVLGKGDIQGMNLTTAQGLGTAGAALAVEALLSMISYTGVRDAKSFQKEVFRVSSFIQSCATPDASGQLCAQITPFVLWCTEALELAPFFDHVATQAGIPDANTNAEIQAAAQTVQAQGVSVPSSATTPGAPPAFLSTPTGSALVASAGIGAGGFLALLLTGALK